jgi:xanthine dehydrogenase molybdopterin-binding subunit B
LVFDWRHSKREITFAQAATICRINQVSLSATGFYKTPDLDYNRQTESGNAFHYFAFGMAVSQVKVDMLTGETEVERVDILHDVGESINQNIDIGQIEGGFVQGLGWLTLEEMKYTPKGQLLNYSPDTYKIPALSNMPKDFRVNLLQNAPNHNTIRRSKAVGEPPFMLALSIWFAIKNAIASYKGTDKSLDLKIPATNEQILLSYV